MFSNCYLRTWLLAVVAVLVAHCFGQNEPDKDPTKVCLPDTLQFETFNLNTDEKGVEAFDFQKNLLGSISPSGSIVQDLNAKKTYMTDANGNCKVMDIPDEDVMTPCLPARAKWIAEANWGFGPNLLPEDAFELTYNRGTLRMLVTKQPGQPRYIMMSKFVECNGNSTVTIYLNPSLTITQDNIFDIPEVCTPAPEF